jgi:transcriptional regulator with XRE-family HTH domain
MKKHSNISTALMTALYETKTTQDGLAKMMDISQAGISKIISGHRRPNPKTMRAFCTALKTKNYHQAVLVLIGHLEDEIEASGMLLSDIEMSPARIKAPGRADIEKYIDTIRAGAIKSRETASLLKDLAWLIHHADIGSGELLQAADPAVEYQVDKKKLKK